MKRVRWKAPRETHRRVLSAADFGQLGVAHPSDETFSKENHFTVLMEDEACDTLVQRLPEEFEVFEAPARDHVVEEDTEGSVVTEDEKTGEGNDAQPVDAINESESGNPDGSSSESVGDEQVEGASSPPKANRRR